MIKARFDIIAPPIVGFPGGSDYKESSCQCRRPRFDPWGQKDPLGKGMATHSSVLAWRIPWTEEPGGLQSMGSQSLARLSDTFTFHTLTLASTWESLPFPMTLTTVTNQEVISLLNYARHSRNSLTTVIDLGMGVCPQQIPGTLRKKQGTHMLKSLASPHPSTVWLSADLNFVCVACN